MYGVTICVCVCVCVWMQGGFCKERKKEQWVKTGWPLGAMGRGAAKTSGRKTESSMYDKSCRRDGESSLTTGAPKWICTSVCVFCLFSLCVCVHACVHACVHDKERTRSGQTMTGSQIFLFESHFKWITLHSLPLWFTQCGGGASTPKLPDSSISSDRRIKGVRLTYMCTTCAFTTWAESEHSDLRSGDWVKWFPHTCFRELELNGVLLEACMGFI